MTDHVDYHFYLKLDKWTKKDAALILSGHNPLQYKHVRFNQDELQNELSEAYQLYRIFCSVNFSKKYGRENYPLDYIVECIKKEITLPEALLASARRLFQRLQQYEHIEQQMNENTANDSTGARERHYLLKIIGALASIHGNKKTKPSISALVEDILQYVADHEMPSTGLGKSNLHKKISEGLAVFEENL